MSNTDEVITYEIAQEQLREIMLETLGEEEADEENGFLETIEDEEEPDEENDVPDINSRPKLQRNTSKGIGLGDQIIDRNASALEVLPTIYIRFVILAAYLILFIMFIVDLWLCFHQIEFHQDASVRANDTLVYLPKTNTNDEPCIRDEIQRKERVKQLLGVTLSRLRR